MLRQLGHACLCRSIEGASLRGTILRNPSPDRLRALIGLNLDNLATVLRLNVAHRIRLFRLSSDVIPLGSHPINQVPWWDEFPDRLAALGEEIRRHHLRVSMHLGQHTVLPSPDPVVVAAASRDLAYHARFLDVLGVDGTHKIVIHGGGVYGDKAAAIERWVARCSALPDNVRARLVIENDERLYRIEDALTLSERTGAPVVFDVFHHRVLAGDDPDLSSTLRRAFATWVPRRDGVPKIHYSSRAPGRRPGAHAEYIDAEEFRAFLEFAPRDIAFDCMLEAKAKDRALLTLREELGLAA